jgi:hypothetical protein
MIPIVDLWLPILVAAGVVTAAAALLWSVVPRPATVRHTPPPLARDLLLMLVYALVIGVFVAYMTGRTLAPGAEYKEVFRIAATTGVLAYAGGQFLGAIRGAQTWEAAGRNFLYGVAFGLLTGGPFAWLWPGS